MTTYTWYDGPVPAGIEIKQVYGIFFTEDRRVLLRTEQSQCNLTGGRPEATDADIEATLRREALDEANKRFNRRTASVINWSMKGME